MLTWKEHLSKMIRPENNKLSFLEWVRNNTGNTVNGYTNHLWNGVTCLEIVVEVFCTSFH